MNYNSHKLISSAMFSLLLILLVPANVKADTILGIYLSASNWSPDFSGNISNTGPLIDLNDELAIDDDSSTAFSFALEHPIPGLPNIKIQRTELDTVSSSILGSDITFGGVTFPTGSDLSSQLDLSHTDYILYYEILDNWVSLDLGVTLMSFDGNINLQSIGLSSNVELDEIVPAGYGKARFEIPGTDIYFGAEGSMLSVGDSSITDYQIHLGWEGDFGLGAEFGYHSFGANWEDFDNSNGDLEFEGYYASVIFHF